MRLGLNLGYWGAGNDRLNTTLAEEADRLGYSVVWVAEAYGSDAPTVLSWVGARTERIALGAAVMEIPARPPAVTAMAGGTRGFYDFVHRNRAIEFHPCSITHDAGVLQAIDGLCAINSALQVDLYGQANASRVKGAIYSGFGGSTDFIIGSLHASGGKSFIALPSWHPKANRSSIVGMLDGPATSFQQSGIVTEQGVAWLIGASEREQAEHLINRAAHPSARDGLRQAAAALELT